MILRQIKEHREGDAVVITNELFIFGISVYKFERITQESNILNQFKPIKKVTKIKGFNNETKD